MPVIQEFYWRAYHIIRTLSPHWLVLFHDSFRLSPAYWGKSSGFLTDCTHYAVDTHLYLAWSDGVEERERYVDTVCQSAERIAYMEREQGVKVVVGEWSLATDNCAMWLNGLNDNGKAL
jgi:glucan 1,3-beta-glucosidase